MDKHPLYTEMINFTSEHPRGSWTTEDYESWDGEKWSDRDVLYAIGDLLAELGNPNGGHVDRHLGL